MSHNKISKLTIQFIGAWVLVIVGVVLIFLGFYAEPVGDIAPTVLTAFGEILTFAGAIMGIDYRYKFKRDELDARMQKENNEEE